MRSREEIKKDYNCTIPEKSLLEVLLDIRDFLKQKSYGSATKYEDLDKPTKNESQEDMDDYY